MQLIPVSCDISCRIVGRWRICTMSIRSAQSYECLLVWQKKSGSLLPLSQNYPIASTPPFTILGLLASQAKLERLGEWCELSSGSGSGSNQTIFVCKTTIDMFRFVFSNLLVTVYCLFYLLGMCSLWHRTPSRNRDKIK